MSSHVVRRLPMLLSAGGTGREGCELLNLLYQLRRYTLFSSAFRGEPVNIVERQVEIILLRYPSFPVPRRAVVTPGRARGITCGTPAGEVRSIVPADLRIEIEENVLLGELYCCDLRAYPLRLAH